MDQRFPKRLRCTGRNAGDRRRFRSCRRHSEVAARRHQQVAEQQAGEQRHQRVERGQRGILPGAQVLRLHPASLAVLAYLPQPPDISAIERLLVTIRSELTSISNASSS